MAVISAAPAGPSLDRMMTTIPSAAAPRPRAAASGLAGGAVLAAPAVAQAAGDAARLHEFHRYGLLACLAVAGVVLASMLVALLRSRRERRGREGLEPFWVEAAWTLIPLILLAVLAWPAIRLLLGSADGATLAVAGLALVRSPRLPNPSNPESACAQP